MTEVCNPHAELRWGLVANKHAPVSRQVSGTWPPLAKQLTTHTVSLNKDGPGWMPANIAPGPREGERVTQWCVLVLDIEAKTVDSPDGKVVTGPFPPSLHEIADRMRLFGMAGALATSHSHLAPAGSGTLGPRYRIVLLVSRPIEVHEIKPLAFSVAEFLGLRECLDSKSLDAARLFYLPRVPAEREHLAESVIIDGEPLDVDSLLLSQGTDHVSRHCAASPESALSSLRVALSDLEMSDLSSATMHLASVGHGSDYGDWQATGAALHSEAHWGREPELLALWLEYSKACGGYKSDADVLRKWREVGGEKSSKAAIFSRAKERGWINPAIGRKRAVETVPVVPNATRYKLLGSKELRELPPIDWRIRHVFPTSGVVAMYGPSGSGKSFLALDMAAAITEGRPWFDHRVKQAPVAYVVLEGEAGFRRRFDALESHWRRTMPEGLGLVVQPMHLTKPQDIADLALTVSPGGVVVIDTLNRTAPESDENSSKDMGVIIEGAKELQRLTGGLVVLIHHTGKDGDRGMRGHSSLFAAMDAVIEVKRDKANPERRGWSVAKSKDDEDGKSHSFQLVVVELGEDAEGEAIRSCVIEPTASFMEQPELGDRERAGLDVLLKLSQSGQGVAPTAWRAGFYETMPGAKQGAKNKAFNRMKEALLEAGRVSERDGRFTPIECFFDV